MTIKDYFSILIPSLALSIALYTFLSNNSKFREFGKRFVPFVILQLISTLIAAFLMFVYQTNTYLDSGNAENTLRTSQKVLEFLVIITFISGWIYLFSVFYKIFGSLYYMRTKRLWKHIKPLSWFHNTFSHRKPQNTSYEDCCLPRTQIKTNLFPQNSLDKINKGGSILLFYDISVDCDEIIVKYIKEVIANSETVDYISVLQQPLIIANKIKDTTATDKLKAITDRLSIIDCFSPHYAFDDKSFEKDKNNLTAYGFMFYDAYSFAELHSAINTSYGRFKEICKKENNLIRKPHRTIVPNLSSLIRFSSEEQYLLYLRHMLSSEKSYEMITLLIEPITMKDDIKNELIISFDVVLQLNKDEKITQIK